MSYVVVIVLVAAFLMFSVFVNTWKKKSGSYQHVFSMFIDFIRSEPMLSFRIYLAMALFVSFLLLMEVIITTIFEAM